LILDRKKAFTSREWDLSSDDGDGRKGIPESRHSALLAVIAECGARSLYFVYQLYQILHCLNNTESTHSHTKLFKSERKRENIEPTNEEERNYWRNFPNVRYQLSRAIFCYVYWLYCPFLPLWLGSSHSTTKLANEYE
jgi:hypothetical protein